MSTTIPEWLPHALAQAILDDCLNALSPLERSQLDRHVERYGEPPFWFKQRLRFRGLTFDELPKP